MEELQNKSACQKIRNLSNIQQEIAFTEFDFYDLYMSTFEKSELGRIKKLLPLHAMAENFGLVSKSLRPLSPEEFLKVWQRC